MMKSIKVLPLFLLIPNYYVCILYILYLWVWAVVWQWTEWYFVIEDSISRRELLCLTLVTNSIINIDVLKGLRHVMNSSPIPYSSVVLQAVVNFSIPRN